MKGHIPFFFSFLEGVLKGACSTGGVLVSTSADMFGGQPCAHAASVKTGSVQDQHSRSLLCADGLSSEPSSAVPGAGQETDEKRKQNRT